MREVVIASSVRTPVGRAFKGTLRTTRPDELAAIAIRGALEREAFKSLCGERKTQERIQYTLKTGKTLRN